jgi:hypothetical protein
MSHPFGNEKSIADEKALMFTKITVRIHHLRGENSHLSACECAVAKYN